MTRYIYLYIIHTYCTVLVARTLQRGKETLSLSVEAKFAFHSFFCEERVDRQKIAITLSYDILLEAEALRRLRVNYNNIHRRSTLISWNLPDWNGKCTRPTGPAPIRLSTLTLPGRECNPPPKRPALAQNGRPGGLAAVKPVRTTFCRRSIVDDRFTVYRYIIVY